MSNVASELLNSIPRGEVIHDPREGDYPEAVFQGAELAQNASGSYAVIVLFGDLTDGNGRAFEHKERYNIPESGSDPVQKRIFLSNLHDLGIVPIEDKRSVHADTEEVREALYAAFKAQEGQSFHLRLKEDNQGFMRAKILRGKK